MSGVTIVDHLSILPHVAHHAIDAFAEGVSTLLLDDVDYLLLVEYGLDFVTKNPSKKTNLELSNETLFVWNKSKQLIDDLLRVSFCGAQYFLTNDCVVTLLVVGQ